MKCCRFFTFLLILVSLYSCAQNINTTEELSNKNSTYYYNIGMAGLTAQNYAVAISNFKKAILKDPNNYKAYDKLAIAYANVDDEKEAIKNIDKALNIKPDYYQAILDKALILQSNKKTPDAVKTLNLCIKNDFCSLKPQAYYELANIYKTTNNTKEYIKNLNLAILYDRNFDIAKFNLARAYIKNNMCSENNIKNKVLFLLNSQKNNKTYDNLLLKSKCYIQAKEFNKASKILQKIIFSSNIDKKYKTKAIKLSKELIILKYTNTNPQENPIKFINK